MEYTASQHWIFTILGFLMLLILVFTLRLETTYLMQSRSQVAQLVMSLISIFIMFFLTLVLLFHWFLNPLFVVTSVMALTPLLLILAGLVMYFRFRKVRDLWMERINERHQLVSEVERMVDEKKREKIRQDKIERGEQVEE